MRVWILFTYLLSCACFAADGAAPVVGGTDDAVRRVKKALEVRLCEDQFWSGGEAYEQLGARAFPMRIWHDGSMFLAEVEGMEVGFGGELWLYYWGCLTRGGEAVIRSNAGGAERFDQDEALLIMDQWAHLMEAAPRYEGSIGPIECGYPFADGSPVKAAMFNEVVKLLGKELKWVRDFKKEREEPTGGEDPAEQRPYVVVVGDFNVSSDSVLVWVEEEAELWAIKFLRDDDCTKVDVVPTDYMLGHTWSVTSKAINSWVTPDFIERVRSHGVVVTIPAN